MGIGCEGLDWLEYLPIELDVIGPNMSLLIYNATWSIYTTIYNYIFFSAPQYFPLISTISLYLSTAFISSSPP